MKNIFNLRSGLIAAGIASLAILAGASNAAAQTASPPPDCAKNAKVNYSDPLLEINTPYRNKPNEGTLFFYIGQVRLENIRDRYKSDFATACGRLFDDAKDDPALLRKAQVDFIVYMMNKINFPGAPEELEKKAAQIRDEIMDNIPFSANAPAVFRGIKREGAEKTGCLLVEADLHFSPQQYFQYAIAGGPIAGFNNARGADVDYVGFYIMRQVVKCLKPDLDETNLTSFAATSILATFPEKRPFFEALRDAAVLNAWAATAEGKFEGERFDNIYALEVVLAGRTNLLPERTTTKEIAESIARKMRSLRFGFDTLKNPQLFRTVISLLIQRASPGELPSIVQLQKAYLASTATPARPAVMSSASSAPSTP